MSAKSSADPRNPRAAALQVLLTVLRDQRSLDAAIEAHEAALPEARDRALCRALAYGVLRHHRRLGALRDQLLRSPLRRRDQDVALTVELGLLQLLDMEVAPHAAVSETVTLARQTGKPWAGRLVNALLRRFQREQAQCLAAVDSDPAVRHSVPDWLAGCLRADWPADWESLLARQNCRAPMTLRVNRRRARPDQVAAQLAAQGSAAAGQPGAPDALVLEQPLAIGQLPGFAEGAVSVQDVAAQFAAPLLAAQDGDRVLDACAAPGGKAAHILEQADVSLLALDRDASRLEAVGATLERLGLKADCEAADAADVGAWWDGRAFDRILLDAPCSGTGVIRRHPDIKWLRRADDIARLQAGQKRLLAALWPLLAPGGRLVYATCSILAAENEAVVAAFMADRADAHAVMPDLPVGQAVGYGRQILTGDSAVDGFYYACLEKR